MSGFSDPILGGIGTLIREYIQSENFVSGTSGWRISKDGSAEFLNVLVRGDLSGSTMTIPAGATAAQNRIVIDSAGIRAYNGATLIFDINVTVGGTFGSLSSVLPAAAGSKSRLALSDGAATLSVGPIATNAIDWTLSAPGGNHSLTGTRSARAYGGVNPDTFSFGKGSPGGNYYEQWLLAAQVTVGGVPSTIINQVLDPTLAESDYNTALDVTTGLWTCPVDSDYTFTLAIGATTWTANDILIMSVIDNASARVYAQYWNTLNTNAAVAPKILSFTKWIQAGTVLKFTTQTTAARTVSTSATAASWLSIKRHL